MAAESGGDGSGPTMVPNQLAMLVPSFDPSKDDLKIYTQKVQLLTTAWPENRYGELATRLILGCSGSAFQKLQLKQSELTKNEKKSVLRIVEILGGTWGQIDLERKYECAEKALYNCVQKQDESNDSYLARADILWTEMLAKEIKLEELQSYITLRGSGLSSEDKKRVILESHTSGSSSLTMKKVSEAIRMLGAGFFHDVTGQKRNRTKTYDASTMYTEEDDLQSEQSTWEASMVTQDDSVVDEDETLEVLLADGDPDAAFITDFESSANEVLQTDTELASCYTAYLEARKRLTEKARFRGFWPLSKPKGKGKGFKGKSKNTGKGYGSNPRRNLAQRIMTSTCRRCGQVGHWKAECPLNQGSSMNSSSAASSNLTVGAAGGQPSFNHMIEENLDALPLEFLNLAEVDLQNIDVTCPKTAETFFLMGNNQGKKGDSEDNTRVNLRNSYQRVLGNNRLIDSQRNPPKICVMPRSRQDSSRSEPICPQSSKAASCSGDTILLASACSKGTSGVLDTGATKTVIGSDHVKELIENFDPSIRRQLKRSKCQITFRFGNQATLEATTALVVPIGKLLLQIAVVPGGTPFLISNSLIRVLKCCIDVDKHELRSPVLAQPISLELTPKGLFLIDINKLAMHAKIEGKPRVAYHVNDEVSTEESPKETLPKVTNSPSTDSEPWPKAHSETRDNCRHPVVITQHGHIGSSISQPADCQPAGGPGASRYESGGSRTTSDQVRQHSQRQDLRFHVGQSSRLDSMDVRSIQQVQQGGSPTSHAVHRKEDQRSRRESSPGSNDPWSHCTHEGNQNGTQGISEEFGSTQDYGDKVQRAHSKPADPNGGTRGPGGRLVRTGNGGSIDGSGDPCRCPSSTSTNAELGEHAGEGGIASEPGIEPAVKELLYLQGNDAAGDLDSDDVLFSTGIHHERSKIDRLVEQYSKELHTISRQHPGNQRKSIDLIEIFCNSTSQLTAQCQNQGGIARRFGLAQGDLQTPEGRNKLFREVCEFKPRHLWFAPSCYPWCAWSQFNGSRSIEAWREMVHLRESHLYQVALGIVLHRWQRDQHKHFHWEQPQRSLMFKLPFLQEIHAYSHCIDFDMCVAGDLKDPINSQPIKKGMIVLSTSRRIYDLLHNQKCPGTHEHQVIEGTTIVNGYRVNRSQFTEDYPRKFARQVSRELLKHEMTDRTLQQRAASQRVEQVLTLQDQPCKKARSDPSTRVTLKSAASELKDIPCSKRRKILSKQTPPTQKEIWEKIFQKINGLTPRVGKRMINDSEILQWLGEVWPEKDVQFVIVCRGTDRALGPIQACAKGEAPYRRSAFIHRSTGNIMTEDNWEFWETLSQRQISRSSHPSKLNMTVFARNPCETHQESSKPEVSWPSDVSQQTSTSQKSQEDRVVHQSPQASEMPVASEAVQVDVNSDQHGPKFKALPRDEQMLLLRAHKNLGHPSHERLMQLLRQQGFRPESILAVPDMKCSACSMSSRPKLSRPSTIKDQLDFNDKIAIDCLKWTNSQGTSFQIMHIIDIGTSYHSACIAPNRSSGQAIENIIQTWFQWAGAPQSMMYDAGTEFNSDEFMNFLQSNNIKGISIAPEAHWQNGKSERHGKIVENMLKRLDSESPIRSYSDLSKVLWFVMQAKNASTLRRGFAPEVLVFGKHTKIPGSITSDESLPAHCLADSENANGIQFREQLALRERARRAFWEADNDASLRRAILRRSRPQRKEYQTGDWVMIWKSQPIPGQWLGPTRVVTQENEHTLWVTMSGRLYRVAPENVREVSALESHRHSLNKSSTMDSVIQELVPGQQRGTTQYRNLIIPDELPVPPAVAQAETLPPQETPGIGSQEVPLSGASSDQPDNEPEAVSIPGQLENSENIAPVQDGIEIPIPNESDSEGLVTVGYFCSDVTPEEPPTINDSQCWVFEVTVSDDDVQQWKSETDSHEMAFLASSES